MRANMIASGKMFVGQQPAGFNCFVYFEMERRLFHAIDQARGFVFINYVPIQTSRPIRFTIAIVG